MSAKKETAEATETMATSATGNSVKYSVEEICRNSIALFGKKREVVIGALHSKYEKVSGKFTKDEVQRAIDEFLKKEVK